MALTWSEIDTLVGQQGSNLIGTNALLGGTLAALLFLFFAFRLGVGIEASIIFGTIFVLWLSSMAIAGSNTMISIGVATALGIALGIILLMGLNSLRRG